MDAKEKAIRYLKKNKCHPTDTETVWYMPFIKEALDIAIQEAKKEIIDDLISKYKKIPIHEGADYITALNKLKTELGCEVE